jgi:alanyl-tRNA synthetase
LLADGVMPSNEGRGYVLRRIMRRAMRHAHILGAKEPLMHRLVGSLAAEMGAAYPELLRAQPLIEATLKQEETQFRRTLDKGIKLLDEATAIFWRAIPRSSSMTPSGFHMISPKTRCVRRA